MTIFFMLFTMFLSSLRINVATYSKLGVLRYPFASWTFCFLTDLSILICSIYYFGWLIGLLAFILHFFSVVHATVGWIFTTLFYKLFPDDFTSSSYSGVSLAYALIIYVIFLVLSFFFSDYASLSSSWTWIHTAVLSYFSVVGFITRFILYRIVKNSSSSSIEEPVSSLTDSVVPLTDSKVSRSIPDDTPSSDPDDENTGTSEQRYLMESANGMMVWVPESKLEQWEEKQEALRRGEEIPGMEKLAAGILSRLQNLGNNSE